MKIKLTGLKKIHMMKMNLHAVLIYINRQTMILIQIQLCYYIACGFHLGFMEYGE